MTSHPIPTAYDHARRKGAYGSARRSVASIAGSAILMGTILSIPARAADPPAAAGTPPADAASAAPQKGAAPHPFAPLDLPEWVIRDAAAPADQPWILMIDDPQCPYCMQLHLAIEKVREEGDAEVKRAVDVVLPFPLAIHDQAAHIVTDAFCLEASGGKHGWSAASYLDWLTIAPWRAEPGWKSATLQDLEKDGGFFDTRYDAHKVLSSRRRDFQTEKAREQSACGPASCRQDTDCQKLCETAASCRTACPAEGAGTGAGTGAETGAATGAGTAAPDRTGCLKTCTDRFVSARYRQLARAHSDCVLEVGPGSAHAKTAAAFAWAITHKVPGTPTVYVGHPAVGFQLIGDSDDLAGFFKLLRSSLADARSRMARAAKTADPS